MKAVIYARTSTNEQSTDNQVPVLQDWARQRDFELVEIYRETESAWKYGHQKELARLLSDCKNGRYKFDVLLVWALDRLSREGAAATLNLINTLEDYCVQVIRYQEPWTERPGEIGEILYAIAGWVARMECKRRSERTKAGLDRAVRQGKKLGRPKGSKDKKKRKERTARIYAQ
ncbi:recombinase family protein [Chloroflexota bacterium]